MLTTSMFEFYNLCFDLYIFIDICTGFNKFQFFSDKMGKKQAPLDFSTLLNERNHLIDNSFFFNIAIDFYYEAILLEFTKKVILHLSFPDVVLKRHCLNGSMFLQNLYVSFSIIRAFTNG